jgi:hypothetical protein
MYVQRKVFLTQSEPRSRVSLQTVTPLVRCHSLTIDIRGSFLAICQLCKMLGTVREAYGVVHFIGLISWVQDIQFSVFTPHFHHGLN